MKKHLAFALFLPLFLVGCALARCADSQAGPHEVHLLPRVMLWAWHGTHELGFVDPGFAGVAFLAGTVRLSGDSVALLSGAERIDVALSTALLPVVRIEIDLEPRAQLDRAQLDDVISGILGFDDRRFVGLQLDFDATYSQRGFYRNLLAEVRQALGHRFLSVTALPSWCLGDPWLPTELVDELVPMVYSMGVDTEHVRGRLVGGGDFINDCRTAVGISADEPVPTLEPQRRLYLFSSKPWSSAVYERLLAEALTGT